MLKLCQGLVERWASLRQLNEQAHGENVLTDSLSSSSRVLARMSSAASGVLHATKPGFHWYVKMMYCMMPDNDKSIINKTLHNQFKNSGKVISREEMLFST